MNYILDIKIKIRKIINFKFLIIFFEYKKKNN